MTETNLNPTASNICTIRIAFPTKTDDEAISFKRKISEVLISIPEAQIDFRLATIPKQPTDQTG